MQAAVYVRFGLALVALTASSQAPAQAEHEHEHMHQAGAMPAAPMVPTSNSATRKLYGPDELYFLHHMIMHHQQAVEMNDLLQRRAERPELLRFGSIVANSQRAEMLNMQSMLDIAASRGLVVPAHHMDADPPMAGMLSSAQMKALVAASGPAFERLWLSGMIFHHDGALAMARALQLREAINGRQPDDLTQMLDDVLLEQSAEIAMMQGWLKAWGLTSAGDELAPAVDFSSPAPGTALPARQPATFLGVAVDDVGIAAVRVGVHDLGSDLWLRHDGTWGEQEMLTAQRIEAGPASVAWSFQFTPPAPGRFAMSVQVEDTIGKKASLTEPAEFVVE